MEFTALGPCLSFVLLCEPAPLTLRTPNIDNILVLSFIKKPKSHRLQLSRAQPLLFTSLISPHQQSSTYLWSLVAELVLFLRFFVLFHKQVVIYKYTQTNYKYIAREK